MTLEQMKRAAQLLRLDAQAVAEVAACHEAFAEKLRNEEREFDALAQALEEESRSEP